MKIVFTDQCKDSIIHAENGIKLNLKGYVLYEDEIKEDDIPSLTLSSLKKEKIICKQPIEDTYEIRKNTYNLTYIPALESTILKNKADETDLDVIAAKMGHYEIDLNKGITDKEFSTILLIGEEFNEYNTYVSDKQKSYLAAVITNVDVDLETPKKIIFKVSFTNIEKEDINESLRIIDSNYDEFTKNEIIKDFNTIQLPDNYTLTPDKKNTDYDAEINIIKFDSEEGTNNVKSYPTNLVFIDKTEKINNIWNTRPRVVAGVDNIDKKVITPNLELSYGINEPVDNKFIVNSIDIQFNKNYASINQSIGKNNLQVDILPEDIDVENLRCIKKRIKRSNLFDYSLVSANKAFFKFDSHNSKYTEGAYDTFEFLNKNNTLGSLDFPVECISLFRSNNNTMSGNNFDSILLDSNSNNLGYSFTESTLIHSSGTDFVNKGVSYETGSTEPQYNSIYKNNVFIGTKDVISEIKAATVSSNNITFIGENKLSTYSVQSANNRVYTNLFNTIPSYVKKADSDEISEIDVNIGFTTKSYLSNFEIGNEALIGFSGLSVDRLPNELAFYKSRQQIGWDSETDRYYYKYSHPKYVPDNTFTVKFGNYNANYNPRALSGFICPSMTDYISNGSTYSDTFSSKYDTHWKFNTVTEKLYKLYFKHSQDSIYALYGLPYTDISADEGDFSINKLVVVGNGYDILGKNITGYSPAQMASNRYSAGQYCKKIDLFSIEKDSYQLVHSSPNDNVIYDSPKVQHFPSMFAVRGTKPLYNKWFKFRSNGGIINSLSDELVKSFNNYQLQNAIYTTNGIYIPRARTSNDVYPLTWETLNTLATIGGDTTKPPPLTVYATLSKSYQGINKFVYQCNGIKQKDRIVYDVYEKDICDYLKSQFKGLIQIAPGQNYIVYLVNTSIHTMNYHGKITGAVPAQAKSDTIKVLKPGTCIEIIFTAGLYTGVGNIAGAANLEYNK